MYKKCRGLIPAKDVVINTPVMLASISYEL